MENSDQLFNREEQVLGHVHEIISRGDPDEKILMDEYIELFRNYKSLLRQSKKIVRISDRLQNQLNTLNEELNHKNSMLEDREYHLRELVEEKTNKIERITIALVNALDNANFLNDSDTGNHIKRVSKYTEIISETLGCSNDFIKRIKLYSSLHDVGKVGIPDIILKKDGKFTDDEFNEMKKHVQIGFNMLNNDDLDEMAKNIALYHHERWDGSGYMNGLRGEQIPLEARVVAIADVYDALISRRVYKPAFSHDEAELIIQESSGNHFDPRVVQAFLKRREDIRRISL